ncbi:MAG: hypothetical protein QF654_13720 [Alphaproteobacteria bacterium]|jgi:hypothetical protein|nr:hypothetical protein [Alphaproteobacteria bacterium]
MLVEIYMCKAGQQLTDGELVHSDSIENRADAEADAQERCGKDPTLAKVAYYKISEEGEFRIFYTYTNPHAVSEKKPHGGGEAVRRRRRKPPPKKKGFWRKLLED